MAKKKRANPEINSSSMADIAFLLLIFFLVTTTIANDKGILMQLPPKPDDIEDIEIKIKEHNLFKVYVNSADRLLVEGEPVSNVTEIRGMAKEHILNNGKNPEMSDNPKDAIVSFKTDRGTSYEMYILVLNELNAAYNEIYAARAGITTVEWRGLDTKDPESRKLYDIGRGVDATGGITIPRNISIAEPSKIGGN